jgi:hypothetical protein
VISRSLPPLLTLLLAFFSGCGYSFQDSKQDTPIHKAGVRTVYVVPITNNTYKPGVENLVYNALVKVISANRRVHLVKRAEDADALLSGSVAVANYGTSASTTADQIFPKGKGSSNIVVATEYQAALDCSFRLENRHPKPGTNPVLWASSFNRRKAFPGNNQIGIFGTTSALINDSEFDRALKDLAESMMADLHESMLAMF